MARVIRFHKTGGPEVLRIEDIDVPAPGPNEVQIRVKALGLNRAEALLRAGTYIETPIFPSRLGLEAAGIVETVGAGVKGFKAGDGVSLVPPISMLRWPTYGELINFPVEHVVKHPEMLSWEEAAAVWMKYLTAYGALIDIAKLTSKDFVVITAGSSSVGLAAIQIAKMVGATPIVVTRTSAKKQALIDFGAVHVIAQSEEDLLSRLTEIAGPNGVRVVLDPIGGPIFEPLTAAMAPGGILLEFGGLSPEPTPFPLFTVLAKTLTLRGYLVHEIVRDPVKLEAAKTFILGGLKTGELKPVIAKTFAFEQIVEAHRYLESNEQFGKVVVSV
ncbi:MAG: NADPH:quinone reductase [Mesorhizobium sp.]|uniref:zinc-dependent alcohol dehydrogenase family protein n=1 Tax=Mesorhizobium sp. TaxID=1871066 RepID=UPI00121011E1|nr:zinc-dependent alcohol dehydrogenase family protein [Mesorhizobium sp.]TIL32466.1 MAG: NADPH:quinone reductase [Mesorhizobium sp.]TIM40343.1 MAG: NADPH:quinone reductase [Mesorhizobium sp.]